MAQQKQTFSHYKQRNTLKALIGIAPNGCITYVRPLYPGSVSDKDIVKKVKSYYEALPEAVLNASQKNTLALKILP